MSLFKVAVEGRPIEFELRSVVLAGYTGRDQEEVRRHVEELAAHGVPGPERVPTYYSCTPELVVSAPAIDVLGPSTSGEAEFILLRSAGELYIGLGSDHTDRELERHSVRFAKQLCPKVVCAELWRLDEVRPHWDSLMLRSFVGAERALYQEGPVSSMLEPDDILARVRRRTGRELEGMLVFSGTIPLTGELTFADHFAAELCDGTTGRRLSLEYAVNTVDPLD